MAETKLAAILKEKGWTGADLQRETKLAKQTIYDAINGGKHGMNSKTLARISKAIDRPVTDFLEV